MDKEHLNKIVREVIEGKRKIGEADEAHDPEGRRDEVLAQFQRGAEAQGLFDIPGAKEDFEAIVKEHTFVEMKHLMAKFWEKYLGINSDQETKK
jgi:hypothetical protein